MNIPTDMQFPSSLEGHGERPTNEQWKALRPWVEYAYRNKTARLIAEELRGYHFEVTPRMLDFRFRKWGNTKNRCKSKVPTAADSTQSCQGPTPCLEVVEYSSPSVRRSKRASKRISPAVRRRSSHLSPRLQRPATTERRPIVSNVFAASIARPFSSEEQLRSNRLVFAMACWSEYQFVLLSQGHDMESVDMICDFGIQVVNACVSLRRRRYTHPSKVIRQVTSTFSAALRSCNLESLSVLFQWLVDWRMTKKKDKKLEPFLRNILDLTKGTAHVELGSEHPVTIMISAVSQEDISLESWAMLFKAINLNYVGRLKGHSKARSGAIQLRFGEILVHRCMFDDVDWWFSDNYEKFKMTEDRIAALEILAASKRRQELYLDARNALERASEILVASNLGISISAHGIFEAQASLEYEIGDLEACQQKLPEALNIRQKLGQTGEMLRWTVSFLHRIYLGQGKGNLVAELSASYPELIENE